MAFRFFVFLALFFLVAFGKQGEPLKPLNKEVQDLADLKSNFIYGDMYLLNPKTIKAIDIIGSELLQKSGISLLVLTKEFILENQKSTKEQRKAFLNNFAMRQKAPFFIIFFDKFDRKIDFLESPDITNFINYDAIYDDYIRELLPLSRELSNAQISGILLSSYVQIADAFARKKGIILESNIVDRGSDLTFKILHYVIFGIIFITIFAFIYARFRKRYA
ncbi:MAG: hypothetical protein E7K04_03190 [Helicobacter sp.]|nr:hypothetical protein [Helicobacter sp.]